MNKIFASVDKAVADIPNGATIALHTWGLAGTTHYLIDAVRRLGIKDITLICPNFLPFPLFEAEAPGPVSLLPQLKKVITPGVGTRPFKALGADFLSNRVKSGELEIEVTTHANYLLRLFAGSMGLGGFYNPVGVGTILEQGKEKRVIDGKEYIFETPLKPDVSLVHAFKADTMGNLVYHGSSRGTNPINAMSGKLVIVEAEQIVQPGELDPDLIHTPGAFVDRVVAIPPGAMSSHEHKLGVIQKIAQNEIVSGMMFGAKREEAR